MEEYELLWEESKRKLLDLVNLYKIPLDKVALSFSGGKDSTVMLELIKELGWKNKIKVIFFNTLMEYQAIYDFVDKKRQEGWIIDETKPKKPAPIIYKQYGIPLKSKKDSDMIYRLQQHDFDFVNDSLKDFETLYKKYPKCKSALTWLTGNGITIGKCPNWLRNRLSQGLDFKVANKCCEYLKKKPVYEFNKDHDIKLSIIGIRKAEAGARATAYKGCINYDKQHNNYKFLPLWNMSNEDIDKIIEWKNIEISKAYTLYGLKRTGCVGCPFGRDCFKELEVLEKYEPNKAIAVKNLFNKSYEVMKGKKLNK